MKNLSLVVFILICASIVYFYPDVVENDERQRHEEAKQFRDNYPVLSEQFLNAQPGDFIFYNSGYYEAIRYKLDDEEFHYVSSSRSYVGIRAADAYLYNQAEDINRIIHYGDEEWNTIAKKWIIHQ